MLNLHLANMNEEIEKRGLDEGQAEELKRLSLKIYQRRLINSATARCRPSSKRGFYIIFFHHTGPLVQH